MSLPKKESIETEDNINKLAQNIQKIGTTNLKIFNYFLKRIQTLEQRISKLEQLRINELSKKDCEKN